MSRVELIRCVPGPLAHTPPRCSVLVPFFSKILPDRFRGMTPEQIAVIRQEQVFQAKMAAALRQEEETKEEVRGTGLWRSWHGMAGSFTFLFPPFPCRLTDGQKLHWAARPCSSSAKFSGSRRR